MKTHKTIGLITFTPSYFSFGLRAIENFLISEGHTVFSLYIFTVSQQNQTSSLNAFQLKTVAEKCSQCDIVGISIISIHSLNRTRQLCRYLKKTITAEIVLGGTPVIISPEIFLEFADYVCIGEGELFFKHFIENKNRSEIPGLGYKTSDGKIIYNRLSPLIDPDAFPDQRIHFDATYFLNEKKLFSLKENPEFLYAQCQKKGYRIMRTRGCPYHCTFCCNNALNRIFRGLGPITRRYSIEKTIKELEYAKETIPDLDKIYFLDDDLAAVGKEEFRALITEYKKRIDLPIWEFSSTFQSLDRDKIGTIIEYGLTIGHIRFGLESANQRVNTLIYRRQFNVEQIFQTIQALLENNIVVWLDLIINNPYEGVADLIQGIRFFEELGKRLRSKNLSSRMIRFIHFNLMYYPGTELYRKALADGIIDDAYHETILSSIHYLEIPHVRIHTLVAYIYRLALDGKYRGLVKRFKNERLLSLIDALLQIKWINTINKHFIRMYRNRGKEKKRHSNGLKRIALQGN